MKKNIGLMLALAAWCFSFESYAENPASGILYVINQTGYNLTVTHNDTKNTIIPYSPQKYPTPMAVAPGELVTIQKMMPNGPLLTAPSFIRTEKNMNVEVLEVTLGSSTKGGKTVPTLNVARKTLQCFQTNCTPPTTSSSPTQSKE